MATYIYNVMYTITVEAENEEEAYQLVMNDDPACNTTDSDIQYVGEEN